MPSESSVSRKIQFYHYDMGVVAGQSVELDRQGILNTLSTAVQERRRMNFTDNSEIYLAEAITPLTGFKLKFTRILGVGLPSTYDLSNLDSEDIPDGRGVGDCNHMILFEGNIIGLELNSRGASIYRIIAFLKTILPQYFPEGGRIEELARPDLQQKIANLGVITEVEVSLKKTHLQQLASVEQDENLWKAMRELQDSEGNVGVATMIIKSKDYRKRKPSNMTGLGASALRVIRGIGGSRTSDAVEGLVIRGVDQETGRKEYLNLLNQQLIITKQVVKVSSRNRAVDTTSVFQAIYDSFTENQEMIRSATLLF